jgi:hypothetical protein
MDLLEKYSRLKAEENPQKRGKLLEGFLRDIFMAARLHHVSTSFRPEGEEIDGAFFWQGRTFLVEAKWYKNAMPASSIYAFLGKVHGKLSGTIGIYFSISGYSEDCVPAVERGKELNVILFDEADIDAIVNDHISFVQLLEDKLFIAGKLGKIFCNYIELKTTRDVTEKAIQQESSIDAGNYSFIQWALQPTPTQSIKDPVIILCEGDTDRLVFESIVYYVMHQTRTMLNFQIITSSGKYSQKRTTLPSMATLITTGGIGNGALVVAFDTDSRLDSDITKQKLEMQQILHDEIPDGWKVHVTAAIPEIEEWLSDEFKMVSINFFSRFEKTKETLKEVNWDNKRNQIPEVNSLIEFLFDFIKQKTQHG